MREIKFRAFNKQCSCKSCGGTFTSWERLLKIRYTTNPDQPNNFFEDDDYVLEQFTRLHDKNGKEIYEGDIIRIEEYSDVLPVHNAAVIFEDGAFKVKGKYIHSSIIHYMEGNSLPRFEVIGNIHENPELLGKTE